MKFSILFALIAFAGRVLAFDILPSLTNLEQKAGACMHGISGSQSQLREQALIENHSNDATSARIRFISRSVVYDVASAKSPLQKETARELLKLIAGLTKLESGRSILVGTSLFDAYASMDLEHPEKNLDLRVQALKKLEKATKLLKLPTADISEESIDDAVASLYGRILKPGQESLCGDGFPTVPEFLAGVAKPTVMEKDVSSAGASAIKD